MKPLPDFDTVVRGARHCIAGERCQGRPGKAACPYWDKAAERCAGDWRKDLLAWALLLRGKDNNDRSGSL